MEGNKTKYWWVINIVLGETKKKPRSTTAKKQLPAGLYTFTHQGMSWVVTYDTIRLKMLRLLKEQCGTDKSGLLKREAVFTVVCLGKDKQSPNEEKKLFSYLKKKGLI